MKTDKVSGWLGTTRFLTLLALVVWVGGLAFLGIAAPAMFKVSRPMGPLMVGAILKNFTPVMYICGVLLMVGWLAEMKLPKPGRAGLLWKLQGACSVVMLLLALYLGMGLMPRITALQPLAIRQGDAEAKWPSPEKKAEFDAAHKGYTSATKLVVFLGLGTLFVFALRTTVAVPYKLEADAI